MAYSIVTKDGITIDGIPDSIPKDDPSLKSEVARLRSTGEKSSMFQEQPVQQVPKQVQEVADGPEQQSMGNEILQGAAQGLKEGSASTVRGLAGGLASTVGVISDPITALINTVLPENMRGGTAVEGVNRILTMLGVPESTTAAQKIVEAGSAGLAGGGGSVMAGQAAAKGAALAPNIVQGVGKAMAAQPVQQLTGGMGAGLASQGAAEMGAPAPVQFGAGLLGGVTGSAIGGASIAAPQVGGVREAKEAGIDLMTSDVRQPKTFAGRWGQSFAEKIPGVGTGGMRKAQQAQRVEAVRSVMREYGADDLANASDGVMNDLLRKRATELSKWTQVKDEVIDKVSSPVLLGEKSAKTISKTVPVNNALKKIDEELTRIKAMGNPEMEPVVKKLENWKTTLQNKDITALVDNQKQLGESFVDPTLAGVRSRGEKAVSAIYGKINDNGVPEDGLAKDIFDYIKETGGQASANKWVIANKNLSGMMGDLELSVLKSALEKGQQTPEMVNNLLFSQKRSDVNALFRNLSPDGKASARAAIIAKAAENKTGDLSPDKFASEVKKMGAQIGVFFTDEDAKQVNGLVRALDATKRASQAALNPATGVQTVLPVSYTAMAALIPGSPMERFLGATAGMALAGGAARLYESKAVRDILIKLPTVKPGGPEEAALLKRLIEATQAKANSNKKEAR